MWMVKDHIPEIATLIITFISGVGIGASITDLLNLKEKNYG